MCWLCVCFQAWVKTRVDNPLNILFNISLMIRLITSPLNTLRNSSLNRLRHQICTLAPLSMEKQERCHFVESTWSLQSGWRHDARSHNGFFGLPNNRSASAECGSTGRIPATATRTRTPRCASPASAPASRGSPSWVRPTSPAIGIGPRHPVGSGSSPSTIVPMGSGSGSVRRRVPPESESMRGRRNEEQRGAKRRDDGHIGRQEGGISDICSWSPLRDGLRVGFRIGRRILCPGLCQAWAEGRM